MACRAAPKPLLPGIGYFAGHYHRCGRQVGRVLATQYEEVVVDRLFAGNVQLIKALQPLVEAAETTLQLDEAKRARTIIRVDAGSGTLDDLNWLLARGYEVMAKEYSGQRVLRLAKTVTEWVQDPHWSERSFGWVSDPPTGYVRPVQRIAVYCRRQDGTFAYGVLICSLSAEQVLAVLGHPRSQAADPVAVLAAYVTFYDLRGGGIETSFKGDKQGLGLTKRTKKRFEAQHMLVLLGSLAHNVPRDPQRDASKRTMDGKVTSLAILTTSFAYWSCGRSSASGYHLCMHRSKVQSHFV